MGHGIGIGNRSSAEDAICGLYNDEGNGDMQLWLIGLHRGIVLEK